jgi:hypothetical protein
MKYLGYTTQATDDTLIADFVRVMGYSPEEVIRHWQGWTASKTRFVRVGPCYPTKSIPAGDVTPGMVMLIDCNWHTVGIVDGPTVLTDTDLLLDLPEIVTVRS